MLEEKKKNRRGKKEKGREKWKREGGYKSDKKRWKQGMKKDKEGEREEERKEETNISISWHLVAGSVISTAFHSYNEDIWGLLEKTQIYR